MGMKEILAKFSQKNIEKKKKYKELEEDYLMQKKLEERQKSSNERELERYAEEKREEDIKKALEQVRKKQQHETWSSNTMLTKDKSILHEDKPILKEKNIFKNEKKLFTVGSIGGTGKKKPSGGNMFFK